MLVRVKNSAKNNFGNSRKVDLKFFVPLTVMQTQNSKGRQIFQGRNFTDISVSFVRLVALYELSLIHI